MDIDLGSGGIALVAVEPGVVGGKQGNVYLLDRRRLPGNLDRRPACSTDSATDASLLAPEAQPHFGKRGPINVFGPYSETYGAMDMARGRSVPALFRDAQGAVHRLPDRQHEEGCSVDDERGAVDRAAEGGDASGRAAWLAVEQLERTLVMENPGSPVVTSNGIPRCGRMGARSECTPLGAARRRRGHRIRCCMHSMQ